MFVNATITAGVCLLAAAGSAFAQAPVTLSDATARALASNYDIRIEREAVDAADGRWLSAHGAYDVQLRMDLSGRHHRDPVNSLFSGAPAGKPGADRSSFASSVTLSQRFRTGSIVSASTSVSREGTDALFSPYAPAYLSSLGVQLQHPLLRGRVTDAARTSLLITALDRDRSGAALARQMQQTVAEVEAAYWTLVATRRDVDVRRTSLMLAEQQRADTEARIEARTVAVSDLAQPVAEVERRRGELFAAQESSIRAERAIKLLMLGDLADPLWSVDLVPADLPEFVPQAVDLAKSIASARRNRPEVAEHTAHISQRTLDVTLQRDSLKPRLDIVAGYTMRGLAGDLESVSTLPIDGVPVSLPDSLSGGVGNSWSNLFDRKFPDASVALSFEMPLGWRDARGRLGEAEAERRRAAAALARTHDHIAIEVMNAATAVDTAASRIRAARAGLAAAETQLRAEEERFSAGLGTSFFVLTRQNDLAVAQLAEIAALTDYQKAQTELARASGSLLEDRNIRVTR